MIKIKEIQYDQKKKFTEAVKKTSLRPIIIGNKKKFEKSLLKNLKHY
jgi:hypothetical protein